VQTNATRSAGIPAGTAGNCRAQRSSAIYSQEVSDEDPYRDPREGQRIAEERRREELAERAMFAGAVRPKRTWILVGISVVLAAATVFVVQRRASRRGDAAPPPPSQPQVLPAAACKQLVEDYHARLARTRACTRDDECVAEPRGHYMTGLDGCARFVVPSKELLAADGVAERWKAGGCADAFRTCLPPRPAICDERLCAELPPDGLPRSWRRQELPGVLTFFAPGDVVDIGLDGMIPEDSWITRFGNRADIELTFDVMRGDGTQDMPVDASIPARETHGTITKTLRLMIGIAPARLDVELRDGADAGGPSRCSSGRHMFPTRRARRFTTWAAGPSRSPSTANAARRPSATRW